MLLKLLIMVRFFFSLISILIIDHKYNLSDEINYIQFSILNLINNLINYKF